MTGRKIIRIIPVCLMALACIFGCKNDIDGNNGNIVTIGGFTLLGPFDDAEIDDYSPTFSWSAADNATAYRLIVATSRIYGTADIVEEVTVTTTNAKLSKPLDTQMTYHWYVEATAKNAAPRDCSRKYVFYTKPWTLDFNRFADTVAFNTYMADNGGANINAEIDSGVAVNGKNTLKIDGAKAIELEKLWGNFSNYDTVIIDYYASAPFNPMIRLYADKTGSGIYGSFDFNTAGGEKPAIPIAAGDGILRLPISSAYMSVTDADNTIISNTDPAEADRLVNPSNIYILGFNGSTGGSLFIKSVKLINSARMADNTADFTSVEEMESFGSLTLNAAQGYRVVVQKSYKTGGSYMNLGIVLYKEFAIDHSMNDMIVLMEIMAGVNALDSGNYIYTFYLPGGSILFLGKLSVN